MTNASADSGDTRLVEQRGDDTSILLHAGRWDRWVDGCVQSMKIFVWAGVEVFLAGQLLASIGWSTRSVFGEIEFDAPPAWAALGILLFAAGWTGAGLSAI